MMFITSKTVVLLKDAFSGNFLHLYFLASPGAINAPSQRHFYPVILPCLRNDLSQHLGQWLCLVPALFSLTVPSMRKSSRFPGAWLNSPFCGSSSYLSLFKATSLTLLLPEGTVPRDVGVQELRLPHQQLTVRSRKVALSHGSRSMRSSVDITGKYYTNLSATGLETPGSIYHIYLLLLLSSCGFCWILTS